MKTIKGEKMKSLTYAMVISLSVFFVVGICPNAYALPSVELECRNPGTQQDIAKTPIIGNNTDKWLAKGTTIIWTASDGDEGTTVLEEPLPPKFGQTHDHEVKGIGKPGNVYTCTAKAILKMQLNEAELEIKGVEHNAKKLCLNSGFKVTVRVANNGGKGASFNIRTPHSASQVFTYNIDANQVSDFDITCYTTGVLKDNHVSAYIYLANPLSGNPQCEKYGTSQSGNWFCDSDMTNQKVTIEVQYGNDSTDQDGNPLLCPEQKITIEAAPENKISIVSSTDLKNTVTVKLNNKTSETSRSHLVEIKSPRDGKIIWHKSISLPAGIKSVKINHQDLDLKSEPTGKMPYDLLIDHNMVGTIFIDNKVIGRQIENQPGRIDSAE